MCEDRYFMRGIDHSLLEEVSTYTEYEYEFRYPLIQMSMPQLFSINMLDELNKFMTSVPPHFDVEVEEVIDQACYYYCDWDSVVAVTDEFLNTAIIEEVRVALVQNYESTVRADNVLQDSIAILSSALQTLIAAVIGVLARIGAPAITDYGCCYRLHRIDNSGNVYFNLMNPSQIFQYLENDICQLGKPK